VARAQWPAAINAQWGAPGGAVSVRGGGGGGTSGRRRTRRVLNEGAGKRVKAGDGGESRRRRGEERRGRTEVGEDLTGGPHLPVRGEVERRREGDGPCGPKGKAGPREKKKEGGGREVGRAAGKGERVRLGLIFFSFFFFKPF
jgi:hypothetical protein